jgi:hypothetical protein
VRLSWPARGMGEAQGKKVDPSAIAVQAIEAQPAFGQIKPMRGKVLACTEQHSRKRASYRSVRTGDPGASGKEEKTWRTERRPSVDETSRTNDNAPSLQDYRRPTGRHRPFEAIQRGPRLSLGREQRQPPVPYPAERRRSRTITCLWSPIPSMVPRVMEPNQHHRPR